MNGRVGLALVAVVVVVDVEFVQRLRQLSPHLDCVGVFLRVFAVVVVAVVTGNRVVKVGVGARDLPVRAHTVVSKISGIKIEFELGFW